jgi:hypothetical protein
MSSKGVSTGFRDAFAGDPVWFRSWLVYVLILAMLGSIFFQMKYLNMAMIAFGSSQVLFQCFLLFLLAANALFPQSADSLFRLFRCISCYLLYHLSLLA